MMGTIIEMSGKRYGRLTVIGFSHLYNEREAMWKCRCDCGAIFVSRGTDIRNGHTNSCGCYMKERATEGKTTHGHSQTKTHRIWLGINQRCYDPNHHKYEIYGGRGIKVCDRWRGAGKFENFLADMGECPDGFSIDRHPDNNGNYEPKNCRWATSKQQNRNRRDNKIIDVFGNKMTLAEACERYGVGYQCAYKRIKRGWSIEKTLMEPQK